jgi:hypothetical protein
MGDLAQLTYQSSFCSPGTDRTGNVTYISACSLVAGETTCPQSCFLATAVVMPPLYTTVAWQWVYMSQYSPIQAWVTQAVSSL